MKCLDENDDCKQVKQFSNLFLDTGDKSWYHFEDRRIKFLPTEYM